MIPSELLLPSVTQTKTPTIALTTQTTTASIHNVESTLAQPTTTISDNEPNTIPLMAGLITTCLLLALAVLTNIVLVMLLYKRILHSKQGSLYAFIINVILFM